jgi:hypothetical protein
MAQLPVRVFESSPVFGAMVMFVVYVLISGLSGTGGNVLARWRDAA